DCYVPPDRHTHGHGLAPTAARTRSAVAEWMREKLRAPEGRQIYARRKAIVEPVFGQAKEGRAFRRFSFRGYDKVTAEWALICLTHNMLKLFRVPACPHPAYPRARDLRPHGSSRGPSGAHPRNRPTPTRHDH